MGACSSNEEVEIDRNVEKHLKRDAESQRNMHRLLLLGAGESGKSTIYKQVISCDNICNTEKSLKGFAY